MTSEQVANFYQVETAKIDQVIPLMDMFKLSHSISDEVEDYRHSELQSAIAGIVASHAKPFTIVVSPTGSGKTWI